ncbi:MAG: CHAT domain-containing protein [Pseudomonadota bacterium]
MNDLTPTTRQGTLWAKAFALGTALSAALTGSICLAAADAGYRLLEDGQFAGARAAFQACVNEANQTQQRSDAIDCLLGQGASTIMLGDLSSARSELEQALTLAADAPVRARQAQLSLGRLATYQARFNEAEQFFDDVLASAGAVDDSSDAARAWLGKAENALAQLNRPALRDALEKALEQTLLTADPALRARLEVAAADTLLRSDETLKLQNWDLNLGARTAAGALELARQMSSPRLSSQAAGLLGEFYLRAGRAQEALELARLATFEAQSVGATDLTYRWQWLSGRALRASGDLPGAQAAMERALTDLSEVRSSLLTGIRGRREPFRQRVGPLFQDHADILLTQAASAAPDRQQQLRRRARQVIEAFKSAELQDYFLDECVVDLDIADTALDSLDRRTAVLYPVLLNDRSEMLVSIGGTIHQYSVPAGADQIGRVAQQFRRSLERRSSHQYRVQAKRLYNWLVRDAEPLLKDAGVDTLVFVPDGSLRNVPLAAFHDGKQFLVERFAIATTPGLSLTDPQPIARQQPSFLLNGLTDAVQGFPALPSVEAELASLGELFPDRVTMLKNQSFVAGNVEQEMTQRPYNIVHFASHGEFQADVSQSFLLTYDDKLNMDQLDDFMQLRRFSDEPVELLTLSACRTAAGDDRAALGLAGIAIRAGARSALGTLWYINDRATSELITEFYGELAQGDSSKAVALAKAQRTLIADRRYQHPGYWAPFLLIGNWL